MSAVEPPEFVTGSGRADGGARAATQPGIAHDHFSVGGLAPQRQLLAWRERVGHIIDVLPSRAQLELPFNASIDRYTVDELRFTDCRSDALLLERSMARISTDRVRGFAFHVMLHGGSESVAEFYPGRSGPHSKSSILALDLDQPVRIRRNACQVLTVFAPRALVEATLPDAETIHGRVLDAAAPLPRLLIGHIAALAPRLAGMDAARARQALYDSIALLTAAFGKQAGLSGNARAAARAAVSSQARRYIEARLHHAELGPDSVLAALRLPRPSLYRLFEHEGGLGAYIRRRRLRAAADELVNFPRLAVLDIAYGLGFKSGSDFTRAFRRAYGMAPQELRAQALLAQRGAPQRGAD